MQKEENKKLEEEIQDLASSVEETSPPPKADLELGTVNPGEKKGDENQGKPSTDEIYIDPAEAEKQKKRRMGHVRTAGKLFLAFLSLVAALGIIGFLVIWLVDNGHSVKFWEREVQSVADVLQTVEEEIVPEPVVTTEEKPMEEPPEQEAETVLLSDPVTLKVLVLNGGGAKGSAGKVADFLKEEGYILVEADNATIFTYTDVTVFYADEEKKQDAEHLQEVLKKEYETTDVKIAETSDEKKSDFVVIVGG